MGINFSSYFNPLNTQFNSVAQFKRLDGKTKAKVLGLTVLGSLFFGIGGVAAFRKSTEVFSKKKISQEQGSQGSQKTDRIAQKQLQKTYSGTIPHNKQKIDPDSTRQRPSSHSSGGSSAISTSEKASTKTPPQDTDEPWEEFFKDEHNDTSGTVPMPKEAPDPQISRSRTEDDLDTLLQRYSDSSDDASSTTSTSEKASTQTLSQDTDEPWEEFFEDMDTGTSSDAQTPKKASDSPISQAEMEILDEKIEEDPNDSTLNALVNEIRGLQSAAKDFVKEATDGKTMVADENRSYFNMAIAQIKDSIAEYNRLKNKNS